ncbi:MAG: cation:proton antiporter, partial [Phycisphaeraceae bacterium]|nr:cation:proton antiporter [Phycisphaeraceae bacterium]
MPDVIVMPILGAGTLSAHDVTVLLLGLAVLLGAAKVCGEVANRLNQPAILGEITAGILLGPTLLGSVFPETFAWVFPVEGDARVGLDAFAIIAVSLLLLVAGVEVNLSRVLRQGKAAMCVSFTGITFCFTMGFSLAWFAPGWLDRVEGVNELAFAMFIGIALAITALPVIAKTLMDLNILRSDLGMLVISSAMLDDLIGWIGFAIVLALISAGAEGGGGGLAATNQLAVTVGMTVAFVVLMLTIGRRVFDWALPHVHARTSWPGGVLGFVLVAPRRGGGPPAWVGLQGHFGG